MNRPPRFVDTPEYILFVSRVLKSLRQRGNYFDVEDLPQIALLSRELALVFADVVAACRKNGATWEEIGTAIGTSKQAAQQRWGRVDER